MENIIWLGHASFYFTDSTSGIKIYYVDPFELQQPNLLQADLIFITHAHPDHLSPQDILPLLKDDSVVIAPANCLDKLDLRPEQQQAVEPNQDYEVKSFVFHTIPAYNTHPEKQQFHPKSNNWVGYIFDLNGKRIYHAGDTDFIPEMRELKELELDIALIPIGGHYTMDVEEAIEAANAIAAKLTIPMHYKRLLGEGFHEAEKQFIQGVIHSEVKILPELQ